MILLMAAPVPNPPPLDTTLLKPGLRLAVGVSGGADSVALLRALHQLSGTLGLVLHVAHLHHGLRGAEADGDRDSVRALAAELGLAFHEARADTQAEAERAAESIEEAARRLRYGWFRQLMAEGAVEAVATAHTRDDQAETVCAKFLRGAWTEGLGGIHPVVEFAEGRIVRPLLGATRSEVETYLSALSQPWREDSSNRHLTFTRNRIRHELLPLLEGWNPRLREHLAQMAELARDEEAWWQCELARLAPQILLPGRPVRGGGRASADGLAVDVVRLAALAPALQRRLLRHAAEQLGASLDFPSTEVLRALALRGRAGQRRVLAGGLRGERTPRELRMTVEAASAAETGAPIREYTVLIPGEIVAPALGVRLRIETAAVVPGASPLVDAKGAEKGAFESYLSEAKEAAEKGLGAENAPEQHTAGAKAHIDSNAFAARLKSCPDTKPSGVPDEGSFSADPGARGYHGAHDCGRTATLRNWKPGDRVRLRYSGGPRKVKEVLERLRVTGTSRALWPVLEVEGRIVWMKGVEVEPEQGFAVVAADLD